VIHKIIKDNNKTNRIVVFGKILKIKMTNMKKNYIIINKTILKNNKINIALPKAIKTMTIKK